MCENFNINVHLQSKSVNINGTLIAYFRRNSDEYRIKHYTFEDGDAKDIVDEQYEVDVRNIIAQILDRKSLLKFEGFYCDQLCDLHLIRTEAVRGHHILIGNDDGSYICCHNLTLGYLEDVTKYWLMHQAIFISTRLDIMDFENFILYKNSDFSDWLREYKGDTDKVLLCEYESMFIKAKEIYLELESNKKDSSLRKILDAILCVFDLNVSVQLEIF